MARQMSTLSNFLDVGFALKPGPSFAPISVSAWAKVSAFTDENVMFSLHLNAANRIQLYTDVTTGNLTWLCRGAAISEAATTGAPSLNTWFHAIGNEVSSSSRRVRLNGGTPATNTNTRTPNNTLTATNLGTGINIGGSAGLTLAEVGVWDASLTADEELALSKGVCPLLIRPEALMAYWPLFGNNSPELDLWKNKYTLTVTGTVPKADHPPIIYPVGAQY